MVGIYKKQEANGLMWLRNYVREHLLTFPLESGKNISILVKEGHTTIKPKLQEDKVIFQVTLEAKGVIGEDLSEQDLNKPEAIHMVELKFAEQVKKCVQAAIKQMQEEGTDSAQLGLIIWRSHPHAWSNGLEERWRDVFKEAEFRITVEASIPDTGLIRFRM